MSIGGVYLPGFPEKDRDELARYCMELMFRDKQHQFTTVSNYCFNICIKNFSERSIQKEERVCVNSCIDKWLSIWDRSVQRVQQVIAPEFDPL